MEKLTEKERAEEMEVLVRELKARGYKILNPQEHRDLIKGKKVVFTEQAIKDAKMLVR